MWFWTQDTAMTCEPIEYKEQSDSSLQKVATQKKKMSDINDLYLLGESYEGTAPHKIRLYWHC